MLKLFLIQDIVASFSYHYLKPIAKSKAVLCIRPRLISGMAKSAASSGRIG
jgi:hypothetical protein